MNRALGFVATFLIGASAVAQHAVAGVSFELVAVSATGGLRIRDAQSVDVGSAHPGDVLSMQLVAKFSLFPWQDDGDPDNEGLQFIQGRFKSINYNLGVILGDLRVTQNTSLFGGVGSSNGRVTDLDGDTDLDVGSEISTTSANYFIANAKNFPTPAWGRELLIADLTFTVTNMYGRSTFSHTDIDFRLRSADSQSLVYYQNGSPLHPPSNDYGFGAITLSIPEPTCTVFLIAVYCSLRCNRAHSRVSRRTGKCAA